MIPIYFFRELSPVPKPFEKPPVDQEKNQNCATDTSSVLSVNTTTSSNVSLPISHHSSSENSSTISSTNSKSLRNVKSAVHGKSIPPTRSNVGRAATAKAKKPPSPNLPKDREQGKLFDLFIIKFILISCVITCYYLLRI